MTLPLLCFCAFVSLPALPCPVASGGASGGAADAVQLALEEEYARAVEIRRTVHAHPELGEREFETAALVATRLRELGLEVREGIAGTGVVGLLRGGRPGPLVAYRADMDALPITERTTLPFASRRTDTWDGEEVGVMHACGHDVHVAIALGVAAVLARPEVREELTGSVMLVFQPAEESVPGPGSHGARRMLEEGVFDGALPAAVFGLHVTQMLEVGEIALLSGGALAAVDRFTIRIRGRQAHGAYPHLGVDPIVALGHVIVALQTIASRNVDTHDTVVVTVGKVAAGNRFNIIPEAAELVGTIRTHDADVQTLVHERLRAIALHTAQAHGATAEVAIDRITPITVNDPGLVERMRPAVEASVGAERMAKGHLPHMGGEDFAFFADRVPGLYYFLGVTDPERDGPPAAIHTPFFDPDEGAIAVGMRTSARILLARLSE